MRIKTVANSHHEIISGAGKGSTPIVTDSADLCWFSFRYLGQGLAWRK
jgi:hypothetical protein